MKKKNGFTLIELLAIIVILAIIAVITVPIILNIIENSRKGAATDSAYGYKDSVNKTYVAELQNHNKLKLNDTYTVTNGTLSGGDFGDEEITSLPISVSGTIPSNGELTYSNNVLTEGWLVIGDYKVTFNSNGTVTTTKNTESTSNNQSSNNTQNYTVTFNYNNGNSSTSETVTSGETIEQPTNPTKDDYTFGGWYSDENLTNEFDFTMPIDENINLYAKWNKYWNYYYSYSNETTPYGTEIDPLWTNYIRENTESGKREVCGVFSGGSVCLDDSKINDEDYISSKILELTNKGATCNDSGECYDSDEIVNCGGLRIDAGNPGFLCQDNSKQDTCTISTGCGHNYYEYN